MNCERPRPQANGTKGRFLILTNVSTLKRISVFTSIVVISVLRG